MLKKIISGIMAIIILDQITKYMAQTHLLLYIPKYINTVINLTLARNTGAAFSLFASASGWQSTFFLCLNIGISIVLLGWLISLYYPVVQNKLLQSWALSLILGGALGNIIDRIRLGYVVDFIDCHIGIYHWPVFNLADSAVCTGVFLLMLSIYHTRTK